MKGTTAYYIDTAIKLHLSRSGSYDALKYNFKVKRVLDETFKQNKFRWQYANVEQLLNNNSKSIEYVIWLIYSTYDTNWLPTHKLIRAITTNRELVKCPLLYFLNGRFKKDIELLNNKYGSLENSIVVDDDKIYPQAYSNYKSKEIHLHTLLLTHLYYKEFLGTQLRDILIWPEFSNFATKKLLPLATYFYGDHDSYIKSMLDPSITTNRT